MLNMQSWLRHEWRRTGLPYADANKACGVKNAATRKYLTADHLWSYPPVEAFVRLAVHANTFGRHDGRPYFSIDGQEPIPGEQWARLRAKFHCEVGVSNVWREPPMRGDERLKDEAGFTHMNQKPLRLLELMLRASSDPGDVIWEPFGGLCSVAVATHKLARACYSAEISGVYFQAASHRLGALLRGQEVNHS
jgi:site-specific DNA-methyltransferase (adenine-specific)